MARIDGSSPFSFSFFSYATLPGTVVKYAYANRRTYCHDLVRIPLFELSALSASNRLKDRLVPTPSGQERTCSTTMSNPPDPDAEPEARRVLLETFTPAAPATSYEIFSGRQEELMRVVDSLSAPGEHVVIFGERGVGKTSLAAMAERIAKTSGQLTVRVNCQAADEPWHPWQRVGEALTRIAARHPDDDSKAMDNLRAAGQVLVTPSVSPHEILTAVEIVIDHHKLAIFFDEIDRIGEPTFKTNLVDLMKAISDQVLPVTVVLIGVAEDVENLIEEHESIGRALNQVYMPRMDVDELQTIIDRGVARAGMLASFDASNFIAHLSTGLPHYTHLVGLQSALLALSEGASELTLEHVVGTLPVAVARAEERVKTLHHAATHSTRQNNLKEVLLAAALTPTDELGYFSPGDVRGALSDILGRQIGISAFAPTLTQFADTRGPVLEKTAKSNRPRYRFVEPLMIPYACMLAIAEGTIDTTDVVQRLSGRWR